MHNSGQSGEAGTPSRATGLRRLSLILAVLLVLSVAGGSYMLVLARSWHAQAEELEATARELGTELAETRAELNATENAWHSVRDQLTDAQQRIIELADTVAQTGDDREVQRQIARYQREVSESAARVASALDSCIDGQRQLITYLEARPAAPTDEDDEEDRAARAEADAALAEFRSEVEDFCQAAEDANTRLQQQLEQQS